MSETHPRIERRTEPSVEMSAEMSAEMSVNAALASLAVQLSPIAGDETIALARAYRRIVAEEVVAAIDLPAFDNAAMDGYALRHADLPNEALAAAGQTTPPEVPSGELTVVGNAYAAHAFAGRLPSGACVRITTGAPLPADADTVVIQEDVCRTGDRIAVAALPAAGANVRRRGEHVRRGQTVVARGVHLGSAELGFAAAVGRHELTVRRRLRVAIASTGDELEDAPQALPPLSAYDGNRPMLMASCRALGFEAIDGGICRDRASDFAALLARASAAGADVLITSGGAAQGDADIVRQAGGVTFVPLNIRPGRGIVFAKLSLPPTPAQRSAPPLILLGLPGNAVAAYVMFHRVARALLLLMAGADERTQHAPFAVPLPLAHPARTRGGRVDYRRARLVHGAGGAMMVDVMREQGSSMLRTITEADALVAIGPLADYAAGDLVDVYLRATLDA